MFDKQELKKSPRFNFKQNLRISAITDYSNLKQSNIQEKKEKIFERVCILYNMTYRLANIETINSKIIKQLF